MTTVTSDTTLSTYTDSVKIVNSALQDIAVLVKPENNPLGQSYYKLTDAGWNRFCPNFATRMSNLKTDFSNSNRFDNFINHYLGNRRDKQAKLKLKNKSNFLPPSQILGKYVDDYAELVNILHCPSIHRVVFTILYKYHFRHSLTYEGILYNAIWILEQIIATFEHTDYVGKQVQIGGYLCLENEWYRVVFIEFCIFG